MFFIDAHAVLFTVRILGASSYETRRANDTASILVGLSYFSVYFLGRKILLFGKTGFATATHQLKMT